MKKRGFTLAEVLLSMAIIGIVAAVTAPTLINMMPNKDKAQTIKYQKLISEINAELLNNRTLYPNATWDRTTLTHIPEYGALLDQASIGKLNKNKYLYLLKEKLDVVDENNPTASEGVFKTADGYMWTVKTNSSGKPTVIIINMDGKSGGTFGSATNKYPDQFAFLIDETNGTAYCDQNNDKITCRYLKCPFYLNNRKLDYECINSDSGKCACK